MTSWTPALVTSSAVAILTTIAFFALRVIIQEAVRADFAKDLERLRAELRARDEELASLRANLLQGLSARQSMVTERRFKAIEAVWASVAQLAPVKTLAKLTERVKMVELMKASRGNGSEAEGARDLGKMLLTFGALLENFDRLSQPLDQRPFAPPRIWMYYSAYYNILAMIALQAKVAAEGVVAEADAKSTIETVLIALPHMKAFLDQWGEAGLPHLVQPLEDKIFEEMALWLEGAEDDRSAIDRAAKIASLARQSVVLESSPAVTIPTNLRASPIPDPPAAE